MFKSFKPISISLSPNTERDDVLLALKLIFQPWLWKKGKAVLELENKFKEYQKAKFVVSFNSGRSALFAILKALELPENSEVFLQAFTCNAVANPVIWAGLKLIYIDCREDDFNIDTEDLRRKITKNSKALIVQHTFGMPADMQEILRICKEHNLILIEDCAHSLGAKYNNQKVGTFGRASFFSFSRDKIISSVYGGMATTNEDALAEKIRECQAGVGHPPNCWILQQLLHPVLLNWVILPAYNFLDIGKIFLILSQVLGILSKAVHKKEKRGKKPDYFPKALPNALAVLALNQFKKLERFNSHRREIADFYYHNLKDSPLELPKLFSERKSAFLRFTVKHKKAHEIIYQMWHKENILIGDWYTSPIAPDDTQLDKVGYKKDCLSAEKLSKATFNLPTHVNISFKEAQKIADFLKTINF